MEKMNYLKLSSRSPLSKKIYIYMLFIEEQKLKKFLKKIFIPERESGSDPTPPG